MSTLTKNERDQLEEVFLSINNSQNLKKRVSELYSSSTLVLKTIFPSFKGKSAETVHFRDKLKKIFLFFTKLKKNLSK